MKTFSILRLISSTYLEIPISWRKELQHLHWEHPAPFFPHDGNDGNLFSPLLLISRLSKIFRTENTQQKLFVKIL